MSLAPRLSQIDPREPPEAARCGGSPEPPGQTPATQNNEQSLDRPTGSSCSRFDPKPRHVATPEQVGAAPSELVSLVARTMHPVLASSLLVIESMRRSPADGTGFRMHPNPVARDPARVSSTTERQLAPGGRRGLGVRLPRPERGREAAARALSLRPSRRRTTRYCFARKCDRELSHDRGDRSAMKAIVPSRAT